jgi:hypothetical protein
MRLVRLSILILLLPCFEALAQHTKSVDAPIYNWAGIDEAMYDYVSDFQRGGWFTSVRQGRFGAISAVGKKAIPCIYDEPFSFYGKYAVVSQNGKHGFLDSNGMTVLPCVYDKILFGGDGGYFPDDCIHVRQHGKWGRVDFQGVVKTPIKFDEISFLHSRFILLRNGDSTGVIDHQNKIIIRPERQTIRESSYENYFVVYGKGKVGVLDPTGKTIVPFAYDHAEEWELNRGYFILEKNKKWGVLDSVGHVVVPFIYDKIRTATRHASDGVFFEVSKGAQCGLIDGLGRMRLPCKYGRAAFLKNGVYAVTQPEDKRLWGVVNDSERVIVPFEYADVLNYANGLFAVLKNGKWAYIGLDNRKVVPVEFDYYRSFKEGKIELPDQSVNQTATLYVDTFGHILRIYPHKKSYSDVGPFHEGMAKVMDSEGYCGYIDTNVKEVVPCVYELGERFTDGLAKVVAAGKTGYVNTQGALVVDTSFAAGSYFVDGLAPIIKDSLYNFIDHLGHVVISGPYIDAGYFVDGYASVKSKDGWGLMAKSGRLVLACKFDERLEFAEGLAAVAEKGKWSFIDTNGNVVIEVSDTITACTYFQDGRAGVATGLGNGFINKNGKLIIPVEPGSGDLFVNGLSYYKRVNQTEFGINIRYGLMDTNGHKITKAIYNSISMSTESTFIIASNRFGYGIIDGSGHPIVPPVYDDLTFMNWATEGNNEIFAAKRFGKWGFINTDNKLLSTFKYDEVKPFSEGLAVVRIAEKWGYINKEGKEVLWLR